jgi:hypothetical protein
MLHRADNNAWHVHTPEVSSGVLRSVIPYLSPWSMPRSIVILDNDSRQYVHPHDQGSGGRCPRVWSYRNLLLLYCPQFDSIEIVFDQALADSSRELGVSAVPRARTLVSISSVTAGAARMELMTLCFEWTSMLWQTRGEGGMMNSWDGRLEKFSSIAREKARNWRCWLNINACVRRLCMNDVLFIL